MHLFVPQDGVVTTSVVEVRASLFAACWRLWVLEEDFCMSGDVYVLCLAFCAWHARHSLLTLSLQRLGRVQTGGVVTDFCSFYHLPSTIIGHEKHNLLKAAYSYYNVSPKLLQHS